jgi:hypothetical protein
MKLRFFVTGALLSMFVALVACSSDSAADGSTCDQAAKVSDDCNASSADAGLTITFDKAKCEASDKKAAQCVIDNKANCDCRIKCAISGTCS